MSKKKHNSPNSHSCTLYVDGMHCSSCEILIERKLLKDEHIVSADASLNDAEVQITYKGAEKPNLNTINKSIKDLGYKLSYGKIGKKQLPLISFNAKGEFILNAKKWKNLFNAFLVALVLIAVFFFVERLNLGSLISVNRDTALPLFIIYGLVAGLSSCAALIGGLLLSLIKQWNETYIDSDNPGERMQPHILFHFGRLISFFVLGGALGLIGGGVNKIIGLAPVSDNTLYALVVFLISAFMFVLALQMLGVGWAQGFRPKAPKFFLRFAIDESNFEGKYMPFVTGFLTFFLPCGFTLIVQGIALATGNFLQSAMIMLFFAIGTLIPLAGISIGGVKLNSKPQLTAKFNLVAGLVIIFFVLYNVNGQLNALGMASLSDISLGGGESESEASTSPVQVDEDGVQVVNMIAKGFKYEFETDSGTSKVITIKAGVPTKLIADNQGIQGCGSFLAARGLINGFKPLQKGENVIDLGTPKKGDYKITCSMGMVPPVTLKAI